MVIKECLGFDVNHREKLRRKPLFYVPLGDTECQALSSQVISSIMFLSRIRIVSDAKIRGRGYLLAVNMQKQLARLWNYWI